MRWATVPANMALLTACPADHRLRLQLTSRVRSTRSSLTDNSIPIRVCVNLLEVCRAERRAEEGLVGSCGFEDLAVIVSLEYLLLLIPLFHIHLHP